MQNHAEISIILSVFSAFHVCKTCFFAAAYNRNTSVAVHPSLPYETFERNFKDVNNCSSDHGSADIRLRLKCDGTRAETRFRLPAKRTSPFKSAGASVQSTTGSRGLYISGSNGSNAGYTMFRGSVKRTGYPPHSPVSPSLSFPCVTVFHHISNGIYPRGSVHANVLDNRDRVLTSLYHTYEILLTNNYGCSN